MTDPNNGMTTYTYDTLNRLSNILYFNSNNFGFSYDALSWRTQLTRPNGINTNYSYDSVSNLLSVLHQQGVNTLDGATYTYDLAGNRTSKTNRLNGAVSNFSYDNAYQLWTVGDFVAVKASKSSKVQQLSTIRLQQVQYQSLSDNKFQQTSTRF